MDVEEDFHPQFVSILLEFYTELIEIVNWSRIYLCFFVWLINMKTKILQYVDVYGGRLEDKNISLVYHYRSVNESLQQRVAAEVSDVVREFGLNPMPAHYAIEIKPPVVWTKGHAAKLILTEIYGSDWSKKARVFYMGDDTSDEDVMRVSFSLPCWKTKFISVVWMLFFISCHLLCD